MKMRGISLSVLKKGVILDQNIEISWLMAKKKHVQRSSVQVKIIKYILGNGL